MNRAAVRRALWCRWFHRYRWRHGKRPGTVVSTYPGAGASLALTAGPGRTFCWACENDPPCIQTRAYRRWCAS